MSITLPLSNRPDMTTIISDEDADLTAFTWRMNGNYVGRSVTENGKPRLDYLHRVILQRMHDDLPDGWQADHIDHDKLNNQRENLRIASHAQQQRNKGVMSNSTTGYIGISRTPNNTYRAGLKVNNKTLYLGTHKSLETAVLIRDAAARRFHGEYASLNMPDTPTPPDIEELLDHILNGGRVPGNPIPEFQRSKYRGVSFVRGRWRARITIDGKDVHLGIYATEQEAAKAYQTAAAKKQAQAEQAGVAVRQQERQYTKAEIAVLRSGIGYPDVARRARALLRVHDGERVKDVAADLGISRCTLYLWHRRFKDKGLAGLGYIPGTRQVVLTGVALARLFELTDHVAANEVKGWSASKLAETLHAETGVKVHPSTICRALKAHGYVYRERVTPAYTYAWFKLSRK